MVTRQQVIDSITVSGAANLDDIRRETRLGMGPCQGGFCTYRAAAIWDEIKQQTPDARSNGAQNGPASGGALLRHFLQERWKGLTAVMWGDQLRQARLDQLIYLDTLGIELLPAELTHRPQEATNDLVTEHPAIATEYHSS
jgi:glycerol-3-phosphate dehydrogenase